MLKKKTSLKELVKTSIAPITIVLIGFAITAVAFCLYFLLAIQNVYALIAMCVACFAYTVFEASMFFNYFFDGKRILKGVIMVALYIAMFLFLSFVALAITGNLETLKIHFSEIVLYAFFIGPSVMFALPSIAVTIGEKA